MKNWKKGLSGNALKWIAIISMVIDHIGAVVLNRVLRYCSYAPNWSTADRSYAVLYYIMQTTRIIGRLAFPIFCFLLVEGFQKTRSKGKFVFRVLVFALLSEIPFDLALAGRVVYWGYQNVMLTLLIGMLVMWGCDLAQQYLAEKRDLLILIWVMCTGLGMWFAQLCHTDYGFKGIFCIMALYFFRYHKLLQCIAGAVSLIWEADAVIGFLFIYLYNGQRGKQMKYFFYWFYPLHLLALYFLCYMMKIHWIVP